MSVIIVIPARYASTRFPGKPLVKLRGADGTSKSLVQRSWEAAVAVKGIDRVVVATDDERIREESEGFGAEVVMTSSECRNGTERCADALRVLGESYDIVVNLQGDAPLTPAWFVEELVASLVVDPNRQVATPVLNTDGRALAGFLSDRKAGRVGGTTVVFNVASQALYFSKEVIPFTEIEYAADVATPVFHHVGVYAYRAAALEQYLQWSVGQLEQLEGLEQLRCLENGMPIHCVEVDAMGREFWELNNPSDIDRIEAMLLKMDAK